MSEGRTCADITLLMGPGIALKDVEQALKKHFRVVSTVFPVSTAGRVVFEMGGYNEDRLPGDVYVKKGRDVTNDDRAEWADKGVRAFQNAVKTDDESVLGDLLADLMHWADKNNYDFDSALERGRDHYTEEIKEEKKGKKK